MSFQQAHRKIFTKDLIIEENNWTVSKYRGHIKLSHYCPEVKDVGISQRGYCHVCNEKVPEHLLALVKIANLTQNI